MIIADNINLLLLHMKWADTEVWRKILNFSSAANDERLKKLLYHLHQVQYAFLALWNNTPIELPKLESFKDIESIAKWGFEYQNKLDDFLSLPQTYIKDKIVQIPWSVFLERKFGKKVNPAIMEETILQITSHSTYHRGQINTHFRELGGEPASVDFIIWVWLGKPEEDWGNIMLS